MVTHFLDEWHKNRKIAFKRFTHLIEELAELADKTDLSIPTSEISEFGYGRSHNQFSIDKALNKKELDDIYHSVDMYFMGLRTFFYQFPKAIANEDNFKNTASANLFDTMMMLPSLQSSFRNVFGKYVSTDKLEQIQEKENRSFKCLWVVWESLRDRPDYNSVSHLLQRYEQMKTTLVEKLVYAIKKEWMDCGFNSERLHVNVNQKTMKVDYTFTNEEECKYGFYYIQIAIGKKVANYNYFSSQRMILQDAIEKVVIEPLYQLMDGSIVSLDGQYFVCNMKSLFTKADEVVKDVAYFSFVPEQVEKEKTITELAVFNQLIAVLNLIIWTCNKLSSLYKQLEYDDVIAKEIIDKYRHLCEKKITETDISIFDNLLELDLQDTSIKNIIDNAIEATKSFMSSIVSDSTWFMDSDQLRSAFNHLNDMKMYIQMQLLSSKHQK